jgi:hypothetical protein
MIEDDFGLNAFNTANDVFDFTVSVSSYAYPRSDCEQPEYDYDYLSYDVDRSDYKH